MPSEKLNEDRPVEIETDQLDEVAGGRKALKTATRPKGSGHIADPCEGGE